MADSASDAAKVDGAGQSVGIPAMHDEPCLAPRMSSVARNREMDRPRDIERCWGKRRPDGERVGVAQVAARDADKRRAPSDRWIGPAVGEDEAAGERPVERTGRDGLVENVRGRDLDRIGARNDTAAASDFGEELRAHAS